MLVASALLVGTLSFLAAFVLHSAIWRWKRPEKQILWLTAVFLILPILLYLGIIILTLVERQQGTAIFFVFSGLWHLALSSAYIMTYPPIQTGCPSLNIVLAVNSSMPEGLSGEEVRRIFSEQALVSKRFKDLTGDKLIRMKEGAWGLSFTGKIISKIFSRYRRLLKLPPGEG